MNTKAAVDTERELDRAIEELRGVAPTGHERPISSLNTKHPMRTVTMQIPVQVNIVFGTASMSVSELSTLEAGATIHLDKRVGEMIDIVVNGVRIARGEITLQEADSSRFGIRVTEVL